MMSSGRLALHQSMRQSLEVCEQDAHLGRLQPLDGLGAQVQRLALAVLVQQRVRAGGGVVAGAGGAIEQPVLLPVHAQLPADRRLARRRLGACRQMKTGFRAYEVDADTGMSDC